MDKFSQIFVAAMVCFLLYEIWSAVKRHLQATEETNRLLRELKAGLAEQYLQLKGLNTVVYTKPYKEPPDIMQTLGEMMKRQRESEQSSGDHGAGMRRESESSQAESK